MGSYYPSWGFNYSNSTTSDWSSNSNHLQARWVSEDEIPYMNPPSTYTVQVTTTVPPAAQSVPAKDDSDPFAWLRDRVDEIVGEGELALAA